MTKMATGWLEMVKIDIITLINKCLYLASNKNMELCLYIESLLTAT